MLRLIRRYKKTTAIIVVVFVLFSAAFEYLVGWDKVLIGTGLTPSPVTVEGEMEVHFIDVGNADCILIRQGDKNLLIDAGERGDVDDILDYFLLNGIYELEMVIATHPHADHIGGMEELLQEIPVQQFVMAFMPEAATPTTAVYEEMLMVLDEKNIGIQEARPGDVYALGEAQVQLLAPLEETDEANDMSVVTRIVFGQHSFLFTGDAETGVEKQLLRSGYDLKADVLKVGHHGSNTSSSAAFLRVVDPTYAVITCGRKNTYGHPHQEVLTRLNQLDASIYRSDISGDIVIVSDGETLTVRTEKG